MAWDERGRCWVAETSDYPHGVKPGGEGNDRIKICEDTDGDGKADKFTVFADGLNIPTSLTFANGGIIVAQPPRFLFLKDTNGDDKADVRQDIMTGWGIGDTHAGPSNLKYGLDNKIWGEQRGGQRSHRDLRRRVLRGRARVHPPQANLPAGATDVQFRYSTDAAYLDTGWFVDDVKVDGARGGVTSESGWFETNGVQDNDWSVQLIAGCDLTPGGHVRRRVRGRRQPRLPLQRHSIISQPFTKCSSQSTSPR